MRRGAPRATEMGENGANGEQQGVKRDLSGFEFQAGELFGGPGGITGMSR